jgi:CHAT domain-containing protein
MRVHVREVMLALLLFVAPLVTKAQSFDEIMTAKSEGDFKKLIGSSVSDGMREKTYFGLMKLGFFYADGGKIIQCDSVLTEIEKNYKDLVVSKVKWRSLDVSDYYYLLASYYYLKNDITRFRAILSKAISLNPEDIFASEYLFRMFVNGSQLDSAELFLNDKFKNLSKDFDVGDKQLVQFELAFKNICELKVLQHDIDGLHYYLTKWLAIKSSKSGDPDVIKEERYKELTMPQLLVLSKYYTLKGNFDKALKVLGQHGYQTSDIFQELDHLRSYAQVFYARNEIDSSISYQHKILTIHEDHVRRLFPTFTESERENYVNSINDDFDVFLSVVSANPAIADKYLPELFNFQLFRKGLLLNTSRQMAKITSRLNSPEAIDLLKKMSAVKDTISLVTLHSTSNDRNRERQSHLAQLNELKESYERQIIRIALQGSNGLLDDIKVDNVAASLPPGSSLLELIRFTKWDKSKENVLEKKGISYLGLILSNGNIPKMVLVSDGNILENRYIKSYSNYVQTKLEDPISYNVFWRPFADQLAGTGVVYVSPDGVYNLVNVNTLQNQRTNKFVLDETEIINVTSGKDLVVNGSQSQITNEALLIGYPAYNSEGQLVAKSGGTRGDFLEEFESLHTVQFDPLPATKHEVDEISSIINGNGGKATVLTGADASESALRSSKIPSILHMATHGFFISTDDNLVNPLLKSGLILAGANNKKKSDDADGILTAFEITSLDLKDTELVVLSACETGLGDVRNGDGVYGLQRAFKVAESRFIVTSLWKVDDDATMKLMTLFYQDLESSRDVIKSFSVAQKQLRDIYPSPYYWGAFKLVGN